MCVEHMGDEGHGDAGHRLSAAEAPFQPTGGKRRTASRCADEASVAESGSRLSEEVLMAFVAELPDGCRTVFNLYVFEEKSHKEIAELLHIKEHSSTSQLHRAKCMLAKRIKEYTEYERKR